MNGEPQGSTASSRPSVENLRSNSDYDLSNSHFQGAYNGSRAEARREHSDGELSRQTSQDTRPMYNPLSASPDPRPRYPNNSQFSIPPRSDSLSLSYEQAREEAQRRALYYAARYQNDQQNNMDMARRRTFSAMPQQMPPLVPRGHAQIVSTNPPYSMQPNSNPGLHNGGAAYQGYPTFPRVPSQTTPYVLPRWQPDAEVTNCPICKTAFSFFYRKHHCRKCGRVVCANCSPHRITLPRSYIVNPPAVHPIEIDLTGDTSTDDTSARLAADQIYPGLGGGQEVRLCNPCVPDPHPITPPQQYPNASPFFGPTAPLRRMPSEQYPVSRRRSHHAGSGPVDYVRYQQNRLLAYPPAQQVQHNPLNANAGTPYGSAPDPPTIYIPRRTHVRSHRPHASLSVLPSARQRAVFEAMTSPEPPPEEEPSQEIPEEDECPICHEELPPKGPDGSETAREAHVASCIEGHFSSSRPTDSSMPQPATAIAAAVTASGATPAEAGSSMPSTSFAGPSTRRKTTGMLVYQATEKDCVGEDGTTQECIICFEDFEPGVDMGRLECLCKFHKACIRSWWETKGVGACPVHQGGLI